MNTLDIIVFLIFTGGIVLMGSLFYRKDTSAREFTNAGRSIPGWVVGMSIFSTYVSSISYLGNPGKSYAGDWNPFVFGLSIPIACWIAARWFVPFYRRHTSMSAYAFLEERFGAWARIYASACYLLTQIARMGSILFLLAMPTNILMGWDLRTVIVITSIAIIFYSMLGGMKAVIWTEAIQGFILIGGALACLGALLFSMPEGPQQAFTIAWNSINEATGSSKFSLGSFDITDLSSSTFWVCLIYGIFINLQNYGSDQNYVQRYHTAKTDEEARHAALFGGWLYIPVSAVFFLIGTCLFSYYRACPDAQVQAFEAAGKMDYVFPYFMVHVLPDGLTGLLIASVFAAGMSTVATSVTSCSTIILTDYWERIRRHGHGDGIGDREHLLVLKGSSVVVGALGIVVALALVNVDSILDAWWKLSSIFSGGMLGLFLLGFLSHKVRNSHALIGVLLGFAVIAWISAWKWIGLPDPGLHEYLAIVLGTMAIFFTGFACQFMVLRKKTP